MGKDDNLYHNDLASNKAERSSTGQAVHTSCKGSTWTTRRGGLREGAILD